MTRYLKINEAIAALSDKERAQAQQLGQQALQEAVAGGKDLQQALNFDMRIVEGLYGDGYRLYNAGQYAKARLIFAFLTLFKPSDARFALALGACHQQQGNFADAILHYSKVAELAPATPLPYFYIYECYMRLELRDWAQLALQLLVERAAAGPFPKMLERGQALLDAHIAIFGDQLQKNDAPAGEGAARQPQQAQAGATAPPRDE